MAQTQTKAKILKVGELGKLRRTLPKSWYAAQGILKGRRKALEKHARTVRGEWR